MPSDCRCFDEVARLHRFFQAWFRGDLPSSDFSVCEGALAPGFVMVSPSGELIERGEILAALQRHRAREPNSFSIETVGRSCQQLNGVHMVTYEERQTGTRSTIRLSTAVLTEARTAFLWHRVHETWVTV